ncbi:SulP family inorganic anion transporter [Denitrobaculum tricleocarpae]|uniref:SulP family inorganic anion transporter n=1 Tax=Denitrobaculum tricleocarpae TaxID=2591009 RepID=A0A545TAV5_9PROT|nr:SulP family inorganic anion transporter [Denitrobaculum tricleocarpae]TQV74341.1 SulP family inorganic anion transporter [Denitrobaculum tricleocarpae]
MPRIKKEPFFQPFEAKNLLPFRLWVGLINRETLRGDAAAAFTNAAVVLPQAIAFAAIAGLPPQYGLYAAMVTPVIAAIFGSSWHLISGPTTAISVVVFATLSGIHEPGSAEYIQAALTITLLAGLFQLLMGLVRLGQLVSLVSHSVMVGFTAGAAILIALSQVSGFLGQKLPRPEEIDAFLAAIWHALPNVDPYVFSIAMGTLLVTALSKKFWPRWPNYLIGLVFGSGLAYVLNAEEHGVQFVQSVPTGIPQFAAPSFSLDDLRTLSSGAFALALIGLLEAVSIARAIALKSKQPLDSNQEIIGQGLSNIGGSFFSAYLGSGSFTRSALNYESGARTPVAALLSALFLFIILIAISPFIERIPIPAMAGLIMLVAWKLIDFQEIRHILTSSASDTVVLIATFFAVVAIDLEFAIYVGVILSLSIFLRRSMRPGLPINVPNAKVSGRPFMSPILWNLPECPQAVFARLQGSLYFGAVEFVEKEFRRIEQERPGQKHFGLMLDGAVGVDLAGADLLIQEAKRREARGGHLYIGVRYPPIRRQLARFHVPREIGRKHIFRRKTEMVPKLVANLDPDICATCTTRVFRECPPVPDFIGEEDGKGEAGQGEGGQKDVAAGDKGAPIETPVPANAREAAPKP